MVHVFSYRDKNYIFDTGSSSLHECDAPTAEYLKSLTGEEADITRFTDAEIRSAIEDVEGLKAEGLLFKEETAARPVKSDEVKALCLHVCHDCNFR